VQFHQRLVSARPPWAEYPTDLCVPHTDYGDIVASMPPAVQRNISLQALALYNGSQPTRWSTIGVRKNLETEVLSGRSLLVVTGDGSVRRVVSVVALHLSNSDGALFVQIGEFRGNGVAPNCQLPGTKQQPNETYSEAFQRLLGSGLDTLLQGRVQLQESHQEISQTPSRTMGVYTKYVRTVCSANMRGGAAINAPSLAYKSPSPAHNRTLRTGPVSHPAFANVAERTVWAAPQRAGAWGLYTWLQPDEFAFLAGGASGEQTLVQWLSLLLPPTEAPPEPSEGVHFSESVSEFSDQAVYI